MTTYRLIPVALAALALLAGCNTLPPGNAQLEGARQELRLAQADPVTRDRAAVELRAAGDAVRLAEEALARKDSTPEVDHWAYLARQRVVIARETGLRRVDEQVSKDALLGRDKIRLAARTQEADSAQRTAQSAQRDAQMANAQSAAAQQQAEAARLQTLAAQRQTLDAQARTDDLEGMLRDLNARQSERGVVVTIGDVLFETDTATLRADGLRSIDKLTDVMKRFPQRTALIEGFTDSTGTQSYNQPLSGRRADAVTNAIVERGIDRARLGTQGFGESFPVAGNDSSSGRQMNRRVEIVLSNAANAVPPRR